MESSQKCRACFSFNPQSYFCFKGLVICSLCVKQIKQEFSGLDSMQSDTKNQDHLVQTIEPNKKLRIDDSMQAICQTLEHVFVSLEFIVKNKVALNKNEDKQPSNKNSHHLGKLNEHLAAIKSLTKQLISASSEVCSEAMESCFKSRTRNFNKVLQSRASVCRQLRVEADYDKFCKQMTQTMLANIAPEPRPNYSWKDSEADPSEFVISTPNQCQFVKSFNLPLDCEYTKFFIESELMNTKLMAKFAKSLIPCSIESLRININCNIVKIKPYFKEILSVSHKIQGQIEFMFFEFTHKELLRTFRAFRHVKSLKFTLCHLKLDKTADLSLALKGTKITNLSLLSCSRYSGWENNPELFLRLIETLGSSQDLKKSCQQICCSRYSRRQEDNEFLSKALKSCGFNCGFYCES
ncbi:unnamed protein product [Moneuplotes crassus]|uniref:Uncharacterized protein n=1 Tax=Euplotes crassus TaxID=5936 RepID=A0AAD1UL30_EUPCR|nr:unnamed protein product [Moneuplotes crassus]